MLKKQNIQCFWSESLRTLRRSPTQTGEILPFLDSSEILTDGFDMFFIEYIYQFLCATQIA